MLTHPLIAPRIGLFYYMCGQSQENSPAATGNLPKASQADFCFLSASGGQLMGGDLSPVTWKETRPCHGLLRHLSKCVSVSKSTAICRPSFEQAPPGAACGRRRMAIVLGWPLIVIRAIG